MAESHSQETSMRTPTLLGTYPGIYNSTCPEHRCIEELHLVCVNFLCKCLTGYSPDSQGGCKSDAASIVVTWISRAIITAFVLFICVVILYLMFSRSSSRERRGSGESLLEGEGSGQACWYDAPPPYVEVVPPPPSYQEAISHAEKTSRASDAQPASSDDPSAPAPPTGFPGLTYTTDAPIRDFARTSCDFDFPSPFDTRPPQDQVATPVRPVTAQHSDVVIHI
ncbi:uncharacterized protein LOC119582589 [Penaeus monodon]|uniref:uncharacterized protein LOC119582589 n=1 Tax=Penaeus monodon TaxID=6687 RepID=UPI0018A6E30D|nr:uncharacterized protein LOC119582589 [Penaeus monodon]